MTFPDTHEDGSVIQVFPNHNFWGLKTRLKRMIGKKLTLRVETRRGSGNPGIEVGPLCLAYIYHDEKKKDKPVQAPRQGPAKNRKSQAKRDGTTNLPTQDGGSEAAAETLSVPVAASDEANAQSMATTRSEATMKPGPSLTTQNDDDDDNDDDDM